MRAPAWVALALTSTPAWAFFGTEVAPLLQLVSGQITEIEKLTQFVGAAEDQTAVLRALNEGIDRSVQQIRSVQSLVERAQGLDPSEIRSLADLNDLLSRAQGLQQQLEDMLEVRLRLADQVIDKGAAQGDTSYRMGQEMIMTGQTLAQESEHASPGRAAQITAAASSAQMLSDGVTQQTMAQLIQLQAMSLELQKVQLEKDLRESRSRRAELQRTLTGIKKRGRK